MERFPFSSFFSFLLFFSFLFLFFFCVFLRWNSVEFIFDYVSICLFVCLFVFHSFSFFFLLFNRGWPPFLEGN